MALPDFVGLINTTYVGQLSQQQKINMRDDLADFFGYSAFLSDGITPNPETKNTFINRNLMKQIKIFIDQFRIERAKKSIIYEQFLTNEDITS